MEKMAGPVSVCYMTETFGGGMQSQAESNHTVAVLVAACPES